MINFRKIGQRHTVSSLSSLFFFSPSLRVSPSLSPSPYLGLAPVRRHHRHQPAQGEYPRDPLQRAVHEASRLHAAPARPRGEAGEHPRAGPHLLRPAVRLQPERHQAGERQRHEDRVPGKRGS